jgi:N-acetylmuramoyl-L-alanine amidase
VIFLEDDFESNYQGFDPNSPESMIGLTLMQEDYLDQSILLARYVQDNFTYKLKRKNRGVKQAGFWVLHNTYMPSILIETGFITNKSEGDYLNSLNGKTNMSKSISDAILDYKSKLNSDVPSVIETTSSHVDITDLELEDVKSVAAPPVNVLSINFKVQISAGSNKLATKPYNFNGLDQITRQKSNSIYRYFYGNTSDYSIAIKLLNKAISKGYTTAYLVAYMDGVRTTIKEALKSTEN